MVPRFALAFSLQVSYQALRRRMPVQLVAVAAVAGALAARFARALSFDEREQLRTFSDPRVR